MATVATDRAPAHLWAVGAISLLWNSFGCYDYTMSKLDPTGYMQGVGMSQEAIDYMAAMPAWLTVFWAIGVWGSLLGSVLLLMRSRHAVTAFAVSLLGLAVSQIYQMVVSGPPGMNTPAMMVMTVVIWAALLFFLWYANRMKKAGVLR